MDLCIPKHTKKYAPENITHLRKIWHHFYVSRLTIILAIWSKTTFPHESIPFWSFLKQVYINEHLQNWMVSIRIILFKKESLRVNFFKWVVSTCWYLPPDPSFWKHTSLFSPSLQTSPGCPWPISYPRRLCAPVSAARLPLAVPCCLQPVAPAPGRSEPPKGLWQPGGYRKKKRGKARQWNDSTRSCKAETVL